MTKVLLFLITSILAIASANAASISGLVKKQNESYYFLKTESSTPILIRPTKSEVINSLKKLSNFDFFQGQGSEINGILALDSVDFVGLQSLLGVWSGNESSVFEFKSFQKLVTYKQFLNFLIPSEKIDYSIAPSSGADWKIFFTNIDSVLLASLTISKKRAVLRFYDLETGDISKLIELTRATETH